MLLIPPVQLKLLTIISNIFNMYLSFIYSLLSIFKLLLIILKNRANNYKSSKSNNNNNNFILSVASS